MEYDTEGNTPQLYHLCIVNLVIGTLYCSKLNYKFGISRIMKSLGRLCFIGKRTCWPIGPMMFCPCRAIQ